MAGSEEHAVSRKLGYGLVLQIAGVLIVLLTFLVRDIFRERAKDFADNLNAAERTFAIRDDLATVKEQLEGITQRANSQTTNSGNVPQTRTISDLKGLENSVFIVKSSAENLCSLTKAMSYNEGNQFGCDVVAGAKSRAGDISTARDKIAKKTLDQQSSSELYTKLANKYYDLANAVDKGGLSIIEHAVQKQEEADATYRFWNIFYDISFGAGFLLGIIGSALGIRMVGMGG